jgi:hypothetical protein
MEGKEIDMGQAEVVREERKPEPRQIEALPAYPDAEFGKNLNIWGEAIASGKAKPEQIVSRSSSRYTLSAEQIEAIYSLAKPAEC